MVLCLGLFMSTNADNTDGTSNRPFWGNGDCGPTEIVGGIGGSGCFERTICKKIRVWIHWGGYDITDVPVPCP